MVEVKRQIYTARMDQDDGEYYLLSGLCRSVDGPYTFGTYLWAEFDDLSKWEHKLVEGPYIHHMVEIEETIQELGEFCKYVPGLTPTQCNDGIQVSPNLFEITQNICL